MQRFISHPNAHNCNEGTKLAEVVSLKLSHVEWPSCQMCSHLLSAAGVSSAMVAADAFRS
jgi:hypothetical protein